MKELDVVKLLKDFNGVQTGTIRTIVLKYDDKNYEVEFFNADGDISMF